jgi:hypothetical protein
MAAILLLIQAAATLLPSLLAAVPAVERIVNGTGTPDDEAALYGTLRDTVLKAQMMKHRLM